MIMKNTKLILFLSLIVASYSLLHSGDMEVFANEYVTRSGKSLHIEETHPQGQSLSDIHLNSSGFDHNLSETLEDRNPIKSVYIGDLDDNEFDEFYIITVSSGSGSYGNIIAFASNRDKSLSMIHFPTIRSGDERFDGYMGHDNFHISGNKLIRSFPIFLSSNKNSNPTGGKRQLTYGLYPGEASWQLKILDLKDIK
ncbi:MAG: hypothetical protein ACI8PB_000416 [Desulforhopalus sp.]|jgi:hypothetical protein